MSESLENAILSQREASLNSTITQLPYVGIELGNQTQNTLQEYVSNGGFQLLSINLYYDYELRGWTTCSVAQAEANACPIPLSSVFFMLNMFTLEVDRPSTVNIILVHITLVPDLDTIDEPPSKMHSSELVASAIEYISAASSALDSRLFTPATLEFARSSRQAWNWRGNIDDKGYPTLYNTLFELQKRVLLLMDPGEFQVPNQTYQPSTDVIFIFDNSTEDEQEAQAERLAQCIGTDRIEELADTYDEGMQAISPVADDDSDMFTTDMMRSLLLCGSSPVLNSSYATDNAMYFASHALWTWKYNQPSYSIERTSKTDQIAMSCAVLDEYGWEVANCYAEYYVACMSESSMYHWEISTEKATYFEAADKCPPGTIFTVPRAPLQNAALISELMKLDEFSKPVWIDFNTIEVQDCWVTGGPYAECPYAHRRSYRSFVTMITVASVLSGFIVFCVFMLNMLVHVPVQRNRKKWRRLVNQFEQNEYESVPA